MGTVQSAHNTLGILFCIIYSIGDEASFASWEFCMHCKSNLQPSHKTCTSLHPDLPERKQKLIHNKVKTPKSKWDIVSQLGL